MSSASLAPRAVARSYQFAFSGLRTNASPKFLGANEKSAKPFLSLSSVTSWVPLTWNSSPSSLVGVGLSECPNMRAIHCQSNDGRFRWGQRGPQAPGNLYFDSQGSNSEGHRFEIRLWGKPTTSNIISRLRKNNNSSLTGMLQSYQKAIWEAECVGKPKVWRPETGDGASFQCGI